MSIKIKINKPEEKKPIQAQVELQVRKTLSGNYLITDHEKMDIVISPSAKSISAIPKMYSGDNSNIYSYQRDLMASLEKGGVIEHTFIQGGLKFGVLEALYGDGQEGVDPVQVALLEIEKFVKKSLGEEIKAKQYDKDIEDRFTDPEESETTELGDVTPTEETPYGRASSIETPYTFVGYGYLY
jgi:hypothetical protein|tara:strand:+ start:278 stop:829 length:552 start_codon:yes stop_codon:yes gene_type:complete